MATKVRPPIVTFRTGKAARGSLRAYRRESERWPYHSARMHGHRFFDLLYFDRGEGRVKVPSRAIRVRPGHVILMTPGDLHDTTDAAHMGGWVVEFTSDLFAAPSSDAPSLLPRLDGGWLSLGGRRFDRPYVAVVPAAERPSWEDRLRRLVRETQGAQLASLEAMRALLALLLVDLARLLAPTEPKTASGSPLLREVFAFIDRCFAEPGVSLSAVARAVGRSPSHVTAVVRRETGMTVLEWLTQRRMAEARRRLIETDEDVSIVADRVGYPDPAYFARLFRREHGVSAREFRQAQR